MRVRAPSRAALAALVVAFSVGACTPAGPTFDAPRPARAVRTTIEPNWQWIAREELELAVTDWKASAGVVVVLDPATGRVFATSGIDHGRDAPMLAFDKTYVTGSTLKTVTIAAALDARTIDVDAHVDCATRSYPTGKIYDPEEHGILSVADVLAVSSNVGTSRIYDTLGLEGFVAALRRFHLGDPPATLPVIDDGASGRAAVFAAGELMEATPMQVAAAHAAIFDGGLYVAPTLSPTRTPVPERVLRPETAQAMIAMLERSVSNDNGSGKRARIDGFRIAGKTGTGELAGGRTYASFVGTVLDRRHAFVVLVGLEGPREGGSGPTAAAPAFARIMSRLLGI